MSKGEAGMTREEAIDRLRKISEKTPIRTNGDDLVAITMAIQALSQEPCEDAEQIDYHDDFATALKKINDYEMTRDERAAISILNAYKVGYESGMKDLEQEPCDDAISREWLMRKATERFYTTNYFNHISAMIEEAPSVTQKSGMWIVSDDGLYRPICDKCGAHPWKGYIPTVEEATEVFKYCPNCGAKMESESDA